MTDRRTLNINFFDFLLVLIVGLCAITALKKIEEAEAGLPPKAEMLIEVTWPDRSKSDVDTWFRAPGGEVVWFSNKQHGPYSLDRDDLGQSNDSIRQPDGTVQTVYVNREIVTLRAIVPGDYTVNLHVYSWRDEAPIEATVRVLRLNPFGILLERKVTLSLRGQEQTAGTFTLDTRGRLLGVSYEQVSLTGIGR